MDLSNGSAGISRRTFVQTMAVAGAGLAVAKTGLGQAAAPAPAAATTLTPDTVNVGIVGVGKQGKILLDYMLKIPGVRVKAVCDIWSYGQKLGMGMVKSAKQEAVVYDDYKAMLDGAKDLDAVVVATPDFWHAPVTNDCLKAGKHVYCEKEMSNTLEAAASMVKTQRQTGKLLQIGHQRRSNPFYKHAYGLMHKDKFAGNVYVVNGQWNQLKPLRQPPAKLLEKYSMAPALLEKWGFNSFSEFYEWRWFNKYAGGPMTDLGSHQVDIFNWFLDATPSSVLAVGGRDRAVAEAKRENVGFVPECFDYTMCIYEWKLADRIVRGYYQVNLNNSYGGFFEVFEGDGGTIATAEIREKSGMFKEQTAKALEWTDEAEKAAQAASKPGGGMIFDPLASRRNKGQMKAEDLAALEKQLEKAATMPHIMHLENFFDTIRGKKDDKGQPIKLNCPAEEAYATAVTVIKANESAITGKKIEFKPEDFKV